MTFMPNPNSIVRLTDDELWTVDKVSPKGIATVFREITNDDGSIEVILRHIDEDDVVELVYEPELTG